MRSTDRELVASCVKGLAHRLSRQPVWLSQGKIVRAGKLWRDEGGCTWGYCLRSVKGRAWRSRP